MVRHRRLGVEPLVTKLAYAFDPTLTDPLDQLRIAIRTFVLHSADTPSCSG